MSLYTGIDGELLSVPPVLPNKGVWATAGTTADDGNDRDAATAMMAAETALDRTVWLRFRFVNGLEGGTYAGSFTWTGTHTHLAAVHLLTLHVTTTSEFDGNVHMAGNLSVDGTFAVGAASTFLGAVQFGDAVVFTDKQTKLGDDAYTAGRKGSVPNANTTIQPWEKDLWVVENLTADRVIVLDHPPSSEIVSTEFVVGTGIAGHHVTLQDSVTLATVSDVLGAGHYQAVQITYDGTRWRRMGGDGPYI